MATVTFRGNPIDVAGSFPQKDQKAPAFMLVGKDLEDVTSACTTSTRKFSEKAGGLASAAVLVASRRTPKSPTATRPSPP